MSVLCGVGQVIFVCFGLRYFAVCMFIYALCVCYVFYCGYCLLDVQICLSVYSLVCCFVGVFVGIVFSLTLHVCCLCVRDCCCLLF